MDAIGPTLLDELTSSFQRMPPASTIRSPVAYPSRLQPMPGSASHIRHRLRERQELVAWTPVLDVNASAI